ncbi:hypothetical protein IGI04_039710 [Brassica rapa subsp. trilocularis]|uniref:Coatomer alpha subunit C-terminal domain-containing protein n=1 Tax=Brassica rapa subsp. trilocularis TaxID=1813537 RepID=A0ABQ7KKN0_BRACM|nr:hypothetical protein IGI04_039710 [Brassica rapa subsp. trilocularis]
MTKPKLSKEPLKIHSWHQKIYGSTYIPICRGQGCVMSFTARFLPTQEENVCAVCDIAVIGVDASGLLALLSVSSPVINSDW